MSGIKRAGIASKTWTKAELEDLGGENLVQLVKDHTGGDASTVDGVTLDRVLRNEDLRQRGLDHLLESRVIGAKSPLELTDDEVADRVSEYGSKVVVSAHVDKSVDDISEKDFARLEEMVLEAHADAVYGKPLGDLSPLERMRLGAAVRNARFEATRTGDVADESGAGDGTGTDVGGTGAAMTRGDVRDALGGIDGDLRFGSGASDDSGTSDSTATSGAGAAGVASGGTDPVSRIGGAGVATGEGFGSGASQPTETEQDTTPNDSGPESNDTQPSTPVDSPNTNTAPPAPPAEDPSSTDYGQGQSMPAYDDDGFVGSVAGPEDYGNNNGTWFLMFGDSETPPHYVNDTTGHVAVMIDGQWVDTTTGTPVDAINNQMGTGSAAGSGSAQSTSGGSEQSESTATTESTESSTDSSAEASESGDSSSDDSDDDDDDDDSGDTTTEATGGDSSSSEEDDDSSNPGGDSGTPNPELTYVDPVARAAFQSTPVGRADRQNDERAIGQNAPGAGLTDPPPAGDDGASGGGPVRFIGGAVDPSPDGTDRFERALSEIDEMRLPNAGLIDPVDDEPEAGGGPVIGGSSPILGGGLFGATLDANSPFDDTLRGLDLDADDIALGLDADQLDGLDD